MLEIGTLKEGTLLIGLPKGKVNTYKQQNTQFQQIKNIYLVYI